MGISFQIVGFNVQVGKVSTPLLCSLYILSHNVDGVVDLLVERTVSIVTIGWMD